MRLVSFGFAVLLATAPTLTSAATVKPVKVGEIVVTDYAVRASLGNLATSAVYVVVTNTGKTADRLVASDCTCAGMAMLHMNTMTNGMTGMSDVTGFDIAPHATLALKPGGDHIMLMGVKHKLVPGAFETVRLKFEHAGIVAFQAPVSETPLSDEK